MNNIWASCQVAVQDKVYNTTVHRPRYVVVEANKVYSDVERKNHVGETVIILESHAILITKGTKND